MKVSDTYGPCSVLPLGGGPAQDELFMSWADAFAHDWNARILDRYPPDRLPGRDPLPVWRLVNHLLKTLHDGPIDWQAFNHRHRIRACAIKYADRPDRIEAEAVRYATHLMDEATEG